MANARVASYMLALIMLVFGVVGLLYAGKPIRENSLDEGIPLAAAAAAALVIGYLELRMFIINDLIEEEELLLEEEKKLLEEELRRLKHIEDVEMHIEEILEHPHLKEAEVREKKKTSPKKKK